METLRLEECEVLEELPEGMGKLTNLRHLHVKKSDALKLPKSIAKLTSLQTLDQVNIFGDGFHLSDLRNMDQLQGKLLINWKGPVFDGAKKANLVNKKHLVSLTLRLWGGESDEMLNALQPNPNLESLQIQRYSGNTLCPNWMSMSLNNLRYLALVKCRRCELVPLLVLGKLVSLEVLQIVHMWKVKKLGFEYSQLDSFSSSSTSLELTLFPYLKTLVLKGLLECEEWEGIPAGLSACTKVMPCLSTLQIQWCDMLKTLPDFLWKTPLQNLSIDTMDVCTVLTQSYKNRGGREWRNISHIPNIKINGEFIQKDRVWIQQQEEEED